MNVEQDAIFTDDAVEIHVGLSEVGHEHGSKDRHPRSCR
jgi:hypothetical protein